MPDNDSTPDAAALLTAAILAPLREVGAMLATAIDELRGEVQRLEVEIGVTRALLVGHMNDVDGSHRV